MYGAGADWPFVQPSCVVQVPGRLFGLAGAEKGKVCGPLAPHIPRGYSPRPGGRGRGRPRSAPPRHYYIGIPAALVHGA